MTEKQAADRLIKEIDDFLISKGCPGYYDLPDAVMIYDWVYDEMTVEEVRETVPHLCWEILDYEGTLPRKMVNAICYGDGKIA